MPSSLHRSAQVPDPVSRVENTLRCEEPQQVLDEVPAAVTGVAPVSVRPRLGVVVQARQVGHRAAGDRSLGQPGVWTRSRLDIVGAVVAPGWKKGLMVAGQAPLWYDLDSSAKSIRYAAELLERLAEAFAPVHGIGKQVHQILPLVAIAVLGDDPAGLRRTRLPLVWVEILRYLPNRLEHRIVRTVVFDGIGAPPRLAPRRGRAIGPDVAGIPDDGDGLVIGQQFFDVHVDGVLREGPTVLTNVLDSFFHFVDDIVDGVFERVVVGCPVCKSCRGSFLWVAERETEFGKLPFQLFGIVEVGIAEGELVEQGHEGIRGFVGGNVHVGFLSGDGGEPRDPPRLD